MKMLLLLTSLFSISLSAATVTATEEHSYNIIIKSDPTNSSPTAASADCEGKKMEVLEVLKKKNAIILDREDNSECIDIGGRQRSQSIISILRY